MEVKRLVESFEHDQEQEANGNEAGPSHLEEARDENHEEYGHMDDESDDAFSFEDRFRQLEEEVAILVAGECN
jgi:protein tyrosine/serine phosphatase